MKNQPQATAQDLILWAENDFKQLNTTGLVTWDAEANFAIQQIYKNEYAVKIAQQNPISIHNAIKNIAAIGLSLNPALKHAYLVPRDNAIHLDVSYMGLMHLAQDTGSILWGQCKLVHQNDQYTNRGLQVEPEHHYSAFGERGDIVGVYCTVKTLDGDFLTHEMPIDDVYAIRNRSKGWKSGKNTPWKTDPKEMIRKTCVKQASKYWPKVEQDKRFDEAVNMLNQGAEGIDFEAEKEPQINYDEVAAVMRAAYDMEDHARFHGLYMNMTDEQKGQLFSNNRFNTKQREFARKASSLHFEYVKQMKHLLDAGEEEDFCSNWFDHDSEEINRSEANKNLYSTLSPEQQKQVKKWITNEENQNNQ